MPASKTDSALSLAGIRDRYNRPSSKRDVVKSLLRAWIPRSLIGGYRRLRRLWLQRRNGKRTVEEVFSAIYEQAGWGGRKGELYSGSGSDDERIVSAYISTIVEQASIEGFQGATFIDLGCGDFRVGEQLLPLCSCYIGVDVVKRVIRRNHDKYGNAKTYFTHSDILEDDLPEGDVCFVRQVLQHLSNEQIGVVLAKLKKYKWVYVTEHHPSDSDSIKPNRDKVHGADIRIERNSGVYMSEPPFGLPEKRLSKVLEVPGVGLQKGLDQGVIRTFLYRPRA